jgi:hypothetical protein
MSEAQQAANAEAAPKQATNMSVSEYANRRRNEINASVQATQESVEEGQVLDPEEGQVEQEIVEASGAETEEVQGIGTEESDEEQETEESEESTEEDSDDVLSNIDLDDLSDEDLRELSDKLGSRAVARFGELTAKRKAAEAELEKLRAEMQSSIAPKVQDSENPYNHIDNLDDLQKVANEVEGIVEWAEDLIFNSDGYTADEVITEVEGKEMTKSDVRKYLQNARKAEKKFIPAQLQKIQKIESARKSGESLMQKAKKEFDWMQEGDGTFDKYKEMLSDERLQGLEKFSPEVHAQLPYLLAHAANSMYARKPVRTDSRTGRLTPPSSTPGSVKSEKTVPPKLKSMNNLSSQFKKSGNKNDFIRLRTLQLSN